MIELRRRMAPVVLLGAVTVVGGFFCLHEAGAADTTMAPGQTGPSVSTPAAAKKSLLPGNPPQVTSPPGGGKVARFPVNQGPQAALPAGSPNNGPAPTITVAESGRISADIKARPLSEALQTMAGKNLFDMRGPMPAGEEVTAQFSGLTLDQALKKLMRGYNYVLMDQGTSQKPVLVLIGKIQRSAPSEQPPPAQAMPQSVDSGQPPGQGASSMSPTAASPPPRGGNRRFPVTAPEGGAIAAPPAATMGGAPNVPQEADMNRQPQVQGQPTGQVPAAGPAQAVGQPAGQSGQAQPPAQGQPAQDGTSAARPRDSFIGSFP